MNFWRPSLVAEFLLTLALLGIAIFSDAFWAARVVAFVFGFLTLMALRGHEGTLGK